MTEAEFGLSGRPGTEPEVPLVNQWRSQVDMDEKKSRAVFTPERLARDENPIANREFFLIRECGK